MWIAFARHRRGNNELPSSQLQPAGQETAIRVDPELGMHRKVSLGHSEPTKMVREERHVLSAVSPCHFSSFNVNFNVHYIFVRHL